MRGRGLFGLSFETIGSVSAIVVGVAALAVSIVETNNARQLRYASALPIIQAGVSTQSDEESLRLRFLLRNPGEGTALIKSVQLLADGEPVDTQDALQARVLGDGLPFADADSTISQTETAPLQAGEETVTLELRWPREPRYMEGGIETYRRLTAGAFELRVCFCDVYDRCWTTVTDAFPERVDACPPATGFPLSLLRSDEAEPET